jgi:hypothetical protein
MGSCDENVLFACGLYLLSEEGNKLNETLDSHFIFRAREEEGEFHTLFGRLKDNRQPFFKYDVRVTVHRR